MRGYTASSYGDGFADVYDAWYPGGPESSAVVDALVGLAQGGPVLELGCGTGRLCLPLAQRGVRVVGLDASAAMLGRLRAKPGAELLTLVEADMADFEVTAPGPAPPGAGLWDRPAFRLVFVAFNTFFNVATVEGQASCLRAVARHLRADGRFALECFVPGDPPPSPEDAIELRSVDADRVVLRVSRRDPLAQTVSGQHVELSEAGGVRLRPWHLRYASPEELDELAASAGLRLIARWADWQASAYDATSTQHVSLYGHR